MHITFICTGNTCRSAMAQGFCQRIINERALKNISCSSCGLAAYTGAPATDSAVRAAAALGADISAHRATALSKYIIDKTDLAVCMTHEHEAVLKLNAPEIKTVVPSGGIPDPYCCGDEVYRLCAERLNAFTVSLIDALTMEIVPMELKHVGRIAELEKKCFSAPWSETAVKAELENNTAHFLTAVNSDRVLGYIGVHEVCSEAYIANIAVDPECRRLGVGDALLKAAQDGAFKRGCEFISLEVRKSNLPAIELYRKNGYRVEGERKKFYSNPEEDALIMTLKRGQ